MHTASLTKVLTLALAVFSAGAHEVDDIHCLKGWQVGFVHDSYTYNAPLHVFTNVTGSFFDIEWYGGVPANVTTGADNVPGATRSGYALGGTWHETLTAYRRHSDALEYTYHGAAIAIAADAGIPAFRFQGYAETMRFESICGGTATYIDLIAYTCSDDQAAAYDLWHLEHVTTFDPLARRLGATIMAGDCAQALDSDDCDESAETEE